MHRSATAVALALALVVSCGGGAPEEDDAPVAVGGRLPAFSLPTLDGVTVASEDLPRQPLVLNFWATWCTPCRFEMPVLQDLHRTPGVTVVTIALDEGGADVVRPFVESERLEYPVLLGDGDVFRRFGGWAIPFTFVVAPDRTIVAIHRGVVSSRVLERDLQRIDG